MLILQKKLSYTLTMCVDVHFLGAVGEHREFLAKGFVLSFSDGLAFGPSIGHLASTLPAFRTTTIYWFGFVPNTAKKKNLALGGRGVHPVTHFGTHCVVHWKHSGFQLCLLLWFFRAKDRSKPMPMRNLLHKNMCEFVLHLGRTPPGKAPHMCFLFGSSAKCMCFLFGS